MTIKKLIAAVVVVALTISIYLSVHTTIEHEADALRASLSKLSWEIAQLRHTANEKESKYYNILSWLTAHTPVTTSEATTPNTNDSTDNLEATNYFGYGKCETQDELTEWDLDYRNYTLVEDCWYFSGFQSCYKNNKETCMIFPSKEEYLQAISQ